MDWVMKNNLQVMIQSIVLFVTLIAYYYYFYRGGMYPSQESDNFTGTAKLKLSTDSSCKNPNCIRCRRYRYVQERARSKLSWILLDLKARDPSTFSTLNRRIPDAILRSGSNSMDNDKNDIRQYINLDNKKQPSSLQDPTVLMVLDLPSREIVTGWHQNACDYLKQHQTRTIISEALYSLGDSKICSTIDDSIYHRSSSLIVSSDDSKWTVNDSSPQGDWKVFQLLNQGVWNPVLLCGECDNGCSREPCRKLFELVRNIPGLLNNSLFGNVFISKIYPGTNIEPHCGPTNIRHRLQFLLKLPDNSGSCDTDKIPALSLSVGREENILWDMHNDTFVFDDSFVHSVTYRDKDPRRDEPTTTAVESFEDEVRIVLIVDLWHPGLQDNEMKLLEDLYPPYTSFHMQ
jgi:hypothetical protein